MLLECIRTILLYETKLSLLPLLKKRYLKTLKENFYNNRTYHVNVYIIY